MTDQVLTVQGLTKRYMGATVDAVHDLTFSLPYGSVCGFIGPNGAGKTTTMRICSTLELPDSGDAWVGGYSVLSHPDEVRRQIGFMPDAFPVPEDIPVGEMLEFFGRAHGLWGTQLQSMTESVIEFTTLESMLAKPFGALSKGMKQRAALATVLMHDPQLLILDEPAAGLDPRARVELRTLMKLLAAQGKTVLISSHILAELSEVCDRAVVIEQGQLRGVRMLREGQVMSEVAAPIQTESGLLTPNEPELRPAMSVYVETIMHPEMVMEILSHQATVQDCTLHDQGLAFSFTGDRNAQAELLKHLVEQGCEPVQFSPKEVNLEDLFLSLTEGNVQ